MKDKLASAIPGWKNIPISNKYPIGVIIGEGIGPEIIPVCVDILGVIERITGTVLKLSYGGPVGKKAFELTGEALSNEVIEWAENIFSAGGAILCGPVGGRFVYEMRSRFGLFCKFTPIKPIDALSDFSILNQAKAKDIDMIMVRENLGGIYYGVGHHDKDEEGRNRISYSFSYNEIEVERILTVAVNLACKRSGRITLVIKSYGLPDISKLWTEIFHDVTTSTKLDTQIMEIDNAVYQIIADPTQFDVIVSSNMFGDILADNASLLLGARGLSYSGNFGARGMATYQTGHGAAYDIAGKNQANPIGQIFSLAMMLKESFGLIDIAHTIIKSTCQVLRKNNRTFDIGTEQHTILSTSDIGKLIIEQLEKNLSESSFRATATG